MSAAYHHHPHTHAAFLTGRTNPVRPMRGL